VDVLISAPLRSELQRTRARCNARFAVARRAHRRLCPAAFATHLRSGVDPIVAAVHARDPAAVPAAFEALYDASLELCGRELVGPEARDPVASAGWTALLVASAGLLLREPHLTVSALSNALYQLGQAGADVGTWVAGVVAVAGAVPDRPALLAAGHVVAWRSGLPQHRAGALRSARSLPPQVAALALGLDRSAAPRIPAILAGLEANPWTKPATADAVAEPALAVVRTAGDFRGLGGLFVRPPRVASVDGALLVTDAVGTWEMHADAFGVSFLRTAIAFPAEAPEGLVDARGGLTFAWRSALFPALAGATSTAATAHTLAVTLPTSHRVSLVALAARVP
jgi:hypothetical protein